jgi:predicted Zn-dependent protease
MAGYFPDWLRGQAYLQAGDGTKAAVEYQKILNRRGIDPLDWLYALARLGLARAYALQDDKAKSRIAYQGLLAL